MRAHRDGLPDLGNSITCVIRSLPRLSPGEALVALAATAGPISCSDLARFYCITPAELTAAVADPWNATCYRERTSSSFMSNSGAEWRLRQVTCDL